MSLWKLTTNHTASLGLVLKTHMFSNFYLHFFKFKFYFFTSPLYIKHGEAGSYCKKFIQSLLSLSYLRLRDSLIQWRRAIVILHQSLTFSPAPTGNGAALIQFTFRFCCFNSIYFQIWVQFIFLISYFCCLNSAGWLPPLEN